MGNRLIRISIGALFLCLLIAVPTEQVGTKRAKRPYRSWRRDAVDDARDLILRGRFGAASGILSKALRGGLPGDRASIAELQLALCRKELGYLDEAIRGFDRAKSRFPQLHGYLELFRGECLEGKGLRDSALSVYHKILSSDPKSPAFRRALFRIGDLYLSRDTYEEAIGVWKRARKIALSPDARAEATLKLGRSLLGAGRYTEAYKTLLEVIRLYPASPHALEASALIDSADTGSDPMKFYWRGLVYLSCGEYDRAVRDFRNFGRLCPERSWEASYYVGKSLYRKRKYAEARRELGKVGRSCPNRYIAGMARFYIARCLDKSGRRRDARERYIRFSEDFPDHPMAARALWNAGRTCETLGDFPRARKIYATLVEKFPDSDFYGRSLWRIGFGLYRDRDYEGALRYFSDQAGRVSDGPLRDAFFFWAGKSAEKLGRDPEIWWRKASDGFPRSYYSVRARMKLGAPQPMIREDVVFPPAPRELKLDREGRDSFIRGALLLEIGLRKFAEAEFGSVLRRARDKRALLHALSAEYERTGLFGKSFRMKLEFAKQMDGWDPDGRGGTYLGVSYPEYYIDLIGRFAEDLALDPALVLAVIRRESFFNHMAISSAGAVGLMQIMPSTGRFLARRFGLGRINRNDLINPELNIRLGCSFLSDQLRRFGDPVLALAAYNAGPSNVRRWVRNIGYSDPDEFVELIPFAETRSYIKQVLKDYSIYRLLITG